MYSTNLDTATNQKKMATPITIGPTATTCLLKLSTPHVLPWNIFPTTNHWRCIAVQVAVLLAKIAATDTTLIVLNTPFSDSPPTEA
jgi:hypothetical protein